MDHKHTLAVYLRGIAMGAADIVPGVSGGTVAFITGIYEELLNSIKAINPRAIQLLFKEGPRAFWEYINGNFLLALGLGIATSIFSLARLISNLLENSPLLVWSFFFGLIIASSLHMARQISQLDWQALLALLLGVVVALAVAEMKPSELSPEPLWVFLAGSIAICAMILPGISGSFILVLLGMYGHILSAIKNLEFAILASFALGCGLGLLSFSHLLSWLLKTFHDKALALLTGFLTCSLYLVWPWKQVMSYYQNSKGESLALEQQNVLPWQYQSLTGVDAETFICLFLMVLGVAVVLFLELIGRKMTAEGGKS